MDYERLMAQARKTNAERDEEEREVGFAAPGDSGPFDLLRTAALAIECGIRTNDWKAVAEGQAMLEQILSRYEPVQVDLHRFRKQWAMTNRRLSNDLSR